MGGVSSIERIEKANARRAYRSHLARTFLLDVAAERGRSNPPEGIVGTHLPSLGDSELAVREALLEVELAACKDALFEGMEYYLRYAGVPSAMSRDTAEQWIGNINWDLWYRPATFSREAKTPSVRQVGYDKAQAIKRSTEEDKSTRKIPMTLTQDLAVLASTGSREEREQRVLSLFGRLLLCKELCIACRQASHGLSGVAYCVDYSFPEPFYEFDNFALSFPGEQQPPGE